MIDGSDCTVGHTRSDPGCPVSLRREGRSGGVTVAEEKARRTAVRWSGAARAASGASCSCGSPEAAAPQAEPDVWDRVLQDIRGRTFSVSCMAFQDAWTMDLDRLASCYLHVLSRDLRLVPFCAYNLTDAAGRPLQGAWRPRYAAPVTS